MADPRISSDPQDDEDVDLEGESNCALLAAGSFISGGVLGGLVGLGEWKARNPRRRIFQDAVALSVSFYTPSIF